MQLYAMKDGLIQWASCIAYIEAGTMPEEARRVQNMKANSIEDEEYWRYSHRQNKLSTIKGEVI